MNRTIKKKKGIKQWIPSNNEYWFSLKCQLSQMVSALPSTNFAENMLEAKEAGDFFRSSVD